MRDIGSTRRTLKKKKNKQTPMSVKRDDGGGHASCS